MLVTAQAALVRRAQDVAAGPMPARTEAGRAPGREAVLPPVAEGQYEPQPSSMSFSEFLSGLNPLQHLPVVGMVYRAITGDIPPTVMRVAGAFLLGGPVGAIITAVGAAAEEIYARSTAPEAGPAGPAAPGAGGPSQLAAGSRGSLSAASVADAGERLDRLRRASETYARQVPAVAMPLPAPALPTAAQASPALRAPSIAAGG
jgi:hypothetical protein